MPPIPAETMSGGRTEAMLILHRADFRALALARLADGAVMLKNRRYSGAYYLCGYVVECGLKAEVNP